MKISRLLRRLEMTEACKKNVKARNPQEMFVLF